MVWIGIALLFTVLLHFHFGESGLQFHSDHRPKSDDVQDAHH